MLVTWVVLGAALGYLTGMLVASVFLVRGRDLDDNESTPWDSHGELATPADPFED